MTRHEEPDTCRWGDIEQVEVLTVLEDLPNAIPLVLAASVSLHVGEDSTLVGPEVVFGTEEEHRELTNLVPQVLDVGGDVPGVVDLCRPPPEGAQEVGRGGGGEMDRGNGEDAGDGDRGR